MRVGTRITVATSALVAASLAVIGLWDLRRQTEDHRNARINEARTIVLSLRVALETNGVPETLTSASELSRELSRATDGNWRIGIIAAGEAGDDTPRARRVKTIVEVRPSSMVSDEEGVLTFSVPLRVPNAFAPKGFDVAGVLEVSHNQRDLAARTSATRWRAVALLLLIVGLVFTAVMLFTRSLVTRPIEKLLAGIDDVARGDLSHVVLSEREDEIGALASRFNDMTFSLRESRGETARQNQARRGLEERLFQTEKLATIGQLAAEIAHEVGTPLNVIAGRARSLERKASKDGVENAAVVKNAGIIAEQATRITRIIQRLLDFARRKIGHVQPEPVNLNEITFTTMEFLEGRLKGAAVKHTLVRAEGLSPVRGLPDQLQQVLLNLLINAIEAMPGGGTLRVETSVETVRRPGLEEAAPEKVVVVEVSDSGVGIPEEMRERIFEPFYTSKDREGGTGLGLAVSHGIVKDHDGWVEVTDSKLGGTSFRLHFPAARATTQPPEPLQAPGADTADEGPR